MRPDPADERVGRYRPSASRTALASGPQSHTCSLDPWRYRGRRSGRSMCVRGQPARPTPRVGAGTASRSRAWAGPRSQRPREAGGTQPPRPQVLVDRSHVPPACSVRVARHRCVPHLVARRRPQLLPRPCSRMRRGLPLHLTMQGVSMVEDMPDERRDDLVSAVRRRLTNHAPVAVQFHRPVVRPEAIQNPRGVHAGRVRPAVGEAAGLTSERYNAAASRRLVSRPSVWPDR
jgi:hypothetical protein